MTSILLLNGPNLNRLGQRQPEVYGRVTLDEIVSNVSDHAETQGVQVEALQSNHEGALIDAIHAAKGTHDGIIFNAGAFTHTSVAIMDALFSVELPCVEIHLSNIHAREEFRHQSYLAKASIGQIAGFGPHGYILAFDALIHHLKAR
ncbi:MAG: type II 3-dehydroquinate dehydratase [Planktomarina sp.]